MRCSLINGDKNLSSKALPPPPKLCVETLKRSNRDRVSKEVQIQPPQFRLKYLNKRYVFYALSSFSEDDIDEAQTKHHPEEEIPKIPLLFYRKNYIKFDPDSGCFQGEM